MVKKICYSRTLLAARELAVAVALPESPWRKGEGNKKGGMDGKGGARGTGTEKKDQRLVLHVVTIKRSSARCHILFLVSSQQKQGIVLVYEYRRRTNRMLHECDSNFLPYISKVTQGMGNMRVVCKSVSVRVRKGLGVSMYGGSGLGGRASGLNLR